MRDFPQKPWSQKKVAYFSSATWKELHPRIPFLMKTSFWVFGHPHQKEGRWDKPSPRRETERTCGQQTGTQRTSRRYSSTNQKWLEMWNIKTIKQLKEHSTSKKDILYLSKPCQMVEAVLLMDCAVWGVTRGEAGRTVTGTLGTGCAAACQS